MEKISIKDGLPEVGSKVLVYGMYVGELYDQCGKDWHHVSVLQNGSYEGIGGDYYSWYVEDIEYWVDLSEIYK